MMQRIGKLESGLELPRLELTISLQDMVRYAAATWDFNPLHYDQEYVHRLGFSGPLVDGQQLGAYLAKQVTEGFGPMAEVKRMSFRFKSMVFAGETIRVEGRIKNVQENREQRVVDVIQRLLVKNRLAIDAAFTQVVVRKPT